MQPLLFPIRINQSDAAVANLHLILLYLLKHQGASGVSLGFCDGQGGEAGPEGPIFQHSITVGDDYFVAHPHWRIDCGDSQSSQLERLQSFALYFRTHTTWSAQLDHRPRAYT